MAETPNELTPFTNEDNPIIVQSRKYREPDHSNNGQNMTKKKSENASKADINPRQRKQMLQRCLASPHLLTTLTALSTFVGIFLGFIIKVYSGDKKWTKRELMYIQFPGDLFLRMLKMLIIPLLSSSIISAIGSLDLTLSKKIGFQSILYYVTTTTVAVFQGIFWVLLIRPGTYAQESGEGELGEVNTGDTSRNVTTVDTLLDLVRNLFPSNIIEACVFQDQTNLTIPKDPSLNASDIYQWDVALRPIRGTNVLGLVMFSVALGIVLAKMGKAAEPLLRVVDALGEATMMLTKAVIWISPIGVLFLVIYNVLEMKSLAGLLTQLGMYFITVLVGLLVHGFITVPSIYVICVREFPFKFIMNMSPAITTAFGTASSSASLPISMQCLEERNHIDPRVSRFVMPIGATINMDGTALYEAVAAIFISQFRKKNLGFVDILAVSITATMASIGAAGIPQAGLVTMVMVLDTVGLPAEDVGLILAVDWLLDRFRTVVNVLGDAIGGGIVAKLSKDELARPPKAAKERYPSVVCGSGVVEEGWNTTPI